MTKSNAIVYSLLNASLVWATVDQKKDVFLVVITHVYHKKGDNIVASVFLIYTPDNGSFISRRLESRVYAKSSHWSADVLFKLFVGVSSQKGILRRRGGGCCWLACCSDPSQTQIICAHEIVRHCSPKKPTPNMLNIKCQYSLINTGICLEKYIQVDHILWKISEIGRMGWKEVRFLRC